MFKISFTWPLRINSEKWEFAVQFGCLNKRTSRRMTALSSETDILLCSAQTCQPLGPSHEKCMFNAMLNTPSLQSCLAFLWISSVWPTPTYWCSYCADSPFAEKTPQLPPMTLKQETHARVSEMPKQCAKYATTSNILQRCGHAI